MSAKRPRPAVPVLVHVDNPAEVGSVTVDTSTIEGKMDTVITNQNRIYDKIPTSSGGSSADLTTVNEKITALATAIGPVSSTSSDNNIFGYVRNLHFAVGDTATIPSTSDTSVRGLLTALKTLIGPISSTASDKNLLGSVKNIVGTLGSSNDGIFLKDKTVRALLYNLREGIGNAENSPSTTGTTVRDLLTAIKENTESGDDLTTVNEKITAINAAVGDGAVVANERSLIGLAKGIKASLGSMEASDAKSSSNIKGRLYNIQSSIGDALNSPSTTGTSVRDLLAAIKQNTASGGGGGSADLTTVNEKTTALAAAIGSASDDSSTVSVIGLLKSITDKY